MVYGYMMLSNVQHIIITIDLHSKIRRLGKLLIKTSQVKWIGLLGF